MSKKEEINNNHELNQNQKEHGQEKNVDRQYLDTLQFNAGKDNIRNSKPGDKNFQTNMNHTLGNNNTTPNNAKSNEKNNQQTNNPNQTPNNEEDKKNSKKSDKCVIF